MTAGFSVKTSHIDDDLILVLKKQTHTVKVIITVRLKNQPAAKKKKSGCKVKYISTCQMNSIVVNPFVVKL
jgi:hypothetical protein